MHNLRALALTSAFTALSAGTWLACSGDDTSPASPTDGGTEAGSGSSSGSSSGATSGSTSGTTSGSTSGATSGSTSGSTSGTNSGSTSGTSSGSTGEGGAGEGGGGEGGSGEGGVPTCSAYCTLVMANCTGANAQYSSMTACMNACAQLPVGASSDTSGNTVGCRTTHAMYAQNMANPHCWHAGPYGYGACGTECEGFCTIATKYCTAAGGYDAGPPPYTSLMDCTTSCAGYVKVDDTADGGGPFGVDGGYNAAGPAGGNTLDCREYHLGAALTGGMNQTVHCAHPGKTSPVCM